MIRKAQPEIKAVRGPLGWKKEGVLPSGSGASNGQQGVTDGSNQGQHTPDQPDSQQPGGISNFSSDQAGGGKNSNPDDVADDQESPRHQADFAKEMHGPVIQGMT